MSILAKLGFSVGGLVAGGAAAYFVTKKVLQNQMDEEINRVTDELRDFYEQKYANVDPEKVMAKVKADVTKQVDSQTYHKLVDDLYAHEEAEVEGWNSPEMREQTQKELDAEHLREQEEAYEASMTAQEAALNKPAYMQPPREGEADSRPRPPKDYGHPHVISFEEFFEDRESGMMDVTYFEKDDTFITDQEQVITDVEATLGKDFLNYFGWKSDDPDTVYIRNNQTGINYSVVREQMSYQEYVVGDIHAAEADS